MKTFTFGIGQEFPSDEGPCTLIGFQYDDLGRTLAQIRVGDRFEAIPLSQLMIMAAANAPRITGADPGSDHAFMEQLSEAQRRHVLSWEGHLLVVRDGLPDVAGADQRYLETVDPARRVDHKAAELGVDRSTITRRLAKYREFGRRSLIHANTRLDSDVVTELPGPVVAVIQAHVEREKQASKKTLRTEYAFVLDDLRRSGLALSDEHTTDKMGKPLPGATDLLTFDRFKRALKVLRGNKPTNQDAKTRQSQTNRPPPLVKHRGFSFADQIMVDATKVDVEVLVNGTQKQRVHCIFGICPETKYVWLRLTAQPPRGKHLGLLLHDIMNPRAFGDSVGDAPLTTAPRKWQVNAWPPVFGDRPAGAVPGIIVADHGPEEENEHVMRVIAEQGLQVEWARSVGPTDKSNVESAIKTFALMCQTVPGHIGNAVKNSPSSAHRTTTRAVTFQALQRMFTAFPYWYAAQPHSGLKHPDYPGRFLTPSEAVHDSLISENELRISGNPNVAMFFLERTKQTPHESGVSFNRLTYVPESTKDLEVLIKESHGRGRNGRAVKQVFFHDSSDPTRIFWNRPSTFEFVPLYAPGGDRRAQKMMGDYAENAGSAFAGHPAQSGTERAESVSQFVKWVRDVAEADFAAQAVQGTPRPTRKANRPTERTAAPVEPVILDDSFDDIDLADYEFEPDPTEWE